MNVLGIETSCDETGIAIVTPERKSLANILLSQIELHKLYGGVIPELAARSHLEVIDHLMAQAFQEAGLQYSDIDAIACTGGPGLIGGVIVGVMAGKTLASILNKPFLAINHLEGHALMARFFNPELEFPFILLLISGGHCQLLKVDGVGHYRKLGGTIDDSLGEAFDKVAKSLKLPYPGGPKIEQLAKLGDTKRFSFPQPLTQHHQHNLYDFSFSGLKTAVLRTIETLIGVPFEQYLHDTQLQLTATDLQDICASFQATVIAILGNRLRHVLSRVAKPDNIKYLVVSGGVAANQAIQLSLQELLQEEAPQMSLYCPPVSCCTDNGLMIAWAGLENFLLQPQRRDLDFSPRSRWGLEELEGA